MRYLHQPLFPLLSLLGLPALAQAQPEAGIQRVAVVRLTFDGDISEAGRELFAQRLVEGLAVARFEVLAGASLDQRLRSEGKRGCAEPSCYPELARAVGVGYLVAGGVAEQSKTYNITLDLINGRTGAVIASGRERCETCGIEEAGEKMNLAASALKARLEALARAPARFVVRSRPAAAHVLLDGKEVGRTPVDVEIAAGEHRLSVEAPGHEPSHRTFTVVSGVDETLEMELVRQPTTFPYRTVGWTAIGVGAAAVVAGIWALVQDGTEISCSGPDKDRMGRCPEVWNTDVLGAVLVGAGAVAGSLGGVSLFLATQGVDSPSEPVRALIGVRGRF